MNYNLLCINWDEASFYAALFFGVLTIFLPFLLFYFERNERLYDQVTTNMNNSILEAKHSFEKLFDSLESNNYEKKEKNLTNFRYSSYYLADNLTYSKYSQKCNEFKIRKKILKNAFKNYVTKSIDKNKILIKNLNLHFIEKQKEYSEKKINKKEFNEFEEMHNTLVKEKKEILDEMSKINKYGKAPFFSIKQRKKYKNFMVTKLIEFNWNILKFATDLFVSFPKSKNASTEENNAFDQECIKASRFYESLTPNIFNIFGEK